MDRRPAVFYIVWDIGTVYCRKVTACMDHLSLSRCILLVACSVLTLTSRGLRKRAMSTLMNTNHVDHADVSYIYFGCRWYMYDMYVPWHVCVAFKGQLMRVEFLLPPRGS